MRIIIADDHPIVLVGLKSLLKSMGADVHVIGEAHTGDEMLDLLTAQPCELVITDFSMSDEPGSIDGLPLLKRLQRDYPELPVIVLTMVRNPALIRGMLAAGVNGVVDKASMMKELLLAMQAVAAGRVYLSESLREDMTELGSVRSSESVASSSNSGAKLSTREAEIVRLYAGGLSVTQIAERVHRSIKTVSQQKNAAMRKLGLDSNSQLYEYARVNGLLT